jgi:hypothetical protein
MKLLKEFPKGYNFLESTSLDSYLIDFNQDGLINFYNYLRKDINNIQVEFNSGESTKYLIYKLTPEEVHLREVILNIAQSEINRYDTFLEASENIILLINELLNSNIDTDNPIFHLILGLLNFHIYKFEEALLNLSKAKEIAANGKCSNQISSAVDEYYNYVLVSNKNLNGIRGDSKKHISYLIFGDADSGSDYYPTQIETLISINQSNPPNGVQDLSKVYINYCVAVYTILYKNLESLIDNLPDDADNILFFMHKVDKELTVNIDFRREESIQSLNYSLVNILELLEKRHKDATIYFFNCKTEVEKVQKQNLKVANIVASISDSLNHTEILPFMYSIYMNAIFENELDKKFTRAMIFGSLFISNIQNFRLLKLC